MKNLFKQLVKYFQNESEMIDAEQRPLIVKPKPQWNRDRSGSVCQSDLHHLSEGISWPYAAFLLINCSLGAGLLNYPSAYDRIGGVLTATIVQVILVVIIIGTILILVYASELNGAILYQDVLLSTCGKRAQQLAAISTILTCYGICVTMLIIIGDQYDRVAQSFLTECLWFMRRSYSISITGILLILPLCFFDRLQFLKHAGTLGVFAMLYIVFVNIYFYATLDTSEVEVRTKPKGIVDFVSTIPVFAFAYQSHEVVIPVYACMKERTVKNFSKVIALSFGLLIVVYFSAGATGYLTFGVNVTSDIMQLYDASNPIVIVAVLALILKNVTTYPQVAVCGRDSLLGFCTELFNLRSEYFLAKKSYKTMVAVVWFFSSLAFAIFIPNIGVVIDVLGSLASANVFIFPSLCLISVTFKSQKWSKRTRTLFYAFASILMFLGIFTFVLIMKQIYSELTNPLSNQHVNFCQ